MENITSDPIRDRQPLAADRHLRCFVSNGAGRQKISKRIAEIPKIYRKVYETAVNAGSQPAAIKAFCLECICWQKNEIINCTSVACPLYLVRPFVESPNKPKDKFLQRESANSNQLVSE